MLPLYKTMRFLKHNHWWKGSVLLVFFLCMPNFAAGAAQEKINEAAKAPATPPETAPPAQAGAGAIPLEEVAMQATQVSNLIRGFAANLVSDNQIETIRKFLPEVSSDLALELKSTTNSLKNEPA